MTTATATQPDVISAVADLDVATNQKSLAAALQFLGQLLPGRSVLPVLTGVLIEGAADTLSISAFDYEISGTELVAGAGVGRALVPGKQLYDFVRSMDKGCQVTMVVEDGKKLVLNGDGVTYRLDLLPLDEYPQLPSTDGQTVCSLGSEQLTGILNVAEAAGRDDTLPVLTGVHFSAEVVKSGSRKSATLQVAATDRYRLAVYNSGVTVPMKLEGNSVLIPASTVAKIHKAFKGTVTFSVNRQHSEPLAIFTDGVRTITTRTLLGEFPRYRALLPDVTNTQVITEAKPLIKAVRQVAIAARRTAPFRITTGVSDMLLEAGNDTDDMSAAKRVDGAVTGDQVVIQFNPEYFLDGIAAVGRDSVAINIVASTKPAVLVGVGRPEFQYLIMPVRITG